MFKKFIRPHCKNLKTLYMFLIMLQFTKSGVTSGWCCQIDVCGNTFLQVEGQLADKSFFNLFPVEIHFWGVPETINAAQLNSYLKRREASHFEFSVTSSIEFQ